MLQSCGIVSSIKDLYWDIRPKPEFGTVEIRVCDTPLSIELAAALAALAQCLARYLLRTRPDFDTRLQLYVARYNKFQACRYGLDALLSDPVQGQQRPLRDMLRELLQLLDEDAQALGCSPWLATLALALARGQSDAGWLRERRAVHGNLNDVVHEAAMRFADATDLNGKGGQ